MGKSYWKSGENIPPKKQLAWPSLGQAVFQIGVVAIIGLLWLGLLFGYTRLTGGSGLEVLSIPEAEANEVDGIDEVGAAPTSTRRLRPTPTTVPASPTSEPAAPDVAKVDLEAGTTPAPQAATPVPQATDTPVPATETPDPIEAAAADAEVSYAQDIVPLLERRCVKCHGGEKDEGGLRIEEGLNVTTYDDLIFGSWNGPVIEPGNADESFLIEQIVKGEMPKKEPRLLPAEIRIITEWVNAGALNN